MSVQSIDAIDASMHRFIPDYILADVITQNIYTCSTVLYLALRARIVNNIKADGRYPHSRAFGIHMPHFNAFEE